MKNEVSARPPVVGEILSPSHPKSILPRKMRVLHVHGDDDGHIILIEIDPVQSHGRMYFRGIKTYDLADVKKDLGKHRSTNLSNGVPPRPDATASDAQLDDKYLRRGQKKSGPRQAREDRWAILKPLVEDRDARQLLFDAQVRAEKIAARATELASEKRSVKRMTAMVGELLNMYWAGGSTPGALTPFADAKGGRGKSRIQRCKLGRRNLPTTLGKVGEEGFVMTERDKDICGFAWRNYYVRGKTKAKALRRMWREFYSDVITDARGRAVHKLKPVGKKPTRPQFERWGQERSPGFESWKAQFTKFALARLDRVLFGSADENITAVGQLGAMDSTSPDIHFVSVLNRLKRIGGAHRILLIDGKYGYIAGFYLGLEAPSGTTVRLAVLHAMSDKGPWLRWLDLEGEQDARNWLQIQFVRIVGDNTDLRCEGVKDWLDDINCGLQFVGVCRSDLNSVVESAHHILHRFADHNSHGTTHGRRTERGETPPDEQARHTIVEAIRETARAIYAHNTMELDMIPTLEAHRELVAKGIKLTRANLTRWDMERGKVACGLMSIDEARMKLLMPIRGTFTRHGVKLLRSDRGDKREFVEPIRYVAKDKDIIARVLRAKVARGRAQPEDFDDTFLHNPYDPNQIFYREAVSGRLITLDAKLKPDDSERLAECSLPDMVQLMRECALDRYNARMSREEALSDLEDGQDRTMEEADDAYQEALAELPKKPSKASLKRNKKENREAEKATYQHGMPVMPPEFTATTDVTDGEVESIQPEPSMTSVESTPPTTATPPPKFESYPSSSPASSESPLVLAILQRIAERSRNG